MAEGHEKNSVNGEWQKKDNTAKAVAATEAQGKYITWNWNKSIAATDVLAAAVPNRTCHRCSSSCSTYQLF
jgi:hypothetical protein